MMLNFQYNFLVCILEFFAFEVIKNTTFDKCYKYINKYMTLEIQTTI